MLLNNAKGNFQFAQLGQISLWIAVKGKTSSSKKAGALKIGINRIPARALNNHFFQSGLSEDVLDFGTFIVRPVSNSARPRASRNQLGNPIPQSRDRVSSAEPKASQPTFLNGNPGFRNAFLSCLGCLRVPKAGRSPLGKRPRRAARSRVTRSRHKRPTPPSTLRSRGPLQRLR